MKIWYLKIHSVILLLFTNYISILIIHSLGLSILSVEELNEMCKEMTAKFSRLSEDLIRELQERDVLIRDQEVRNQFVASLMKVEGKKKAVSHAKAQAAANPTSSSKRFVRKAKNTLKKKAESSSDIINQCKVSYLFAIIILPAINGKISYKIYTVVCL